MQELELNNKIAEINYLISSIFDIEMVHFSDTSRKTKALLSRQLRAIVYNKVLKLNKSEISRIFGESACNIRNSIIQIHNRYDTQPIFREKFDLLLSKYEEKFSEDKKTAENEYENLKSLTKSRILQDSKCLYKKIDNMSILVDKIKFLTKNLIDLSEDIQKSMKDFGEKYDL